jgi:hypothetical protein
MRTLNRESVEIRAAAGQNGNSIHLENKSLQFAADGADSIFERRPHLDDPASSAALATKEISMRRARRNVCARRSRPASARGFWGATQDCAGHAARGVKNAGFTRNCRTALSYYLHRCRNAVPTRGQPSPLGNTMDTEKPLRGRPIPEREPRAKAGFKKQNNAPCDEPGQWARRRTPAQGH